MSGFGARLLRQVQQSIARYDLFASGESIVVGVSGGPDSLCLLHVLHQLRADMRLRLHVAHLDHGLRGGDGEEDAAFVRTTAAAWGLECTVERQDVSVLTPRPGVAVEETARQCRYSFLADVCRRIGATTIAVGHNADDQSETVLMHWLRGAGLSGLRGMLPVTPLDSLRLASVGEEAQETHSLRLVRPLLQVTRDDIEAYCQEHALEPRFDRSNLDTTFNRNRLRHELLPLLETYNPRVRDILRRSATVIADDYALLQELLQRAWSDTVVSEDGRMVEFRLNGWRALPLSLQRATVREAVRRLRRSLRDVSWIHIEDALWLAREKSTGAQATLPQGLMLTIGYESLVIASMESPPRGPDLPLLHVSHLSLARSGPTVLPGTAWRAEITLLVPSELPSGWQRNPDRWQVFLDAGAVENGLALRSRVPGDRFQPLGMGGRTVSVSDYMINRKLPRDLRDRWPLLTGPGRIVWVAGYRQDQRTQVTPATRQVLRVRLRRAAEGD